MRIPFSRAAIAGAGALLAAAPAAAAPLIFSGVITAELGYGSNPFLVEGGGGGEGYGGLWLSPTLTHLTPTSSTSLAGSYYRQQYFSGYGNSETYGATLSHAQQLNEHLNVFGAASYSVSDNALLSPSFNPLGVSALVPAPVVTTDTIGTGTDATAIAAAPLLTAPTVPLVTDPLTTGQRSHLLTVTGGLAWQATARDSLSGSASYSHSSYGSQRYLIASDYDNYGGTLGYSHAVNARTRVGLQVSANELHSANYPNSSSISPAVTLQQILSPIWTLNANVGVIHQHIGAPYSSNSTSLGFSGQICGRWPRRNLCGSVSRQSAASGFGGLRTDLSVAVSYSEQLTEHSTLSFAGSFDNSDGRDRSALLPGTFINVPSERIFQARADYSRQLGRRLSAGASLRGQWRDFSGFGSARSIGGSLNLSYRVGRI